MAFTRWDPLRDLLALQEQIGQIVGTDAPGWTPPVDLYETSGAFVLTAELPGLARDDIEIHAEESRIVIRGERGGHVPCEQYHRVERGHGRFSRAFLLARADRRGVGHRRPQGRAAHDHDSKGGRPRRAAGGRGVRRFAVSVLLIVAGFAAGLTITSRTRAAADAPALPTAGVEPAAPIAAAPADAQRPQPPVVAAGPDFTRVASAAVKGVANISSVQVMQRRTSPFANDPFFQYFFGDQDDLFGGRSRRSLSLGSGVIVSSDGYVVTNSHVIGENLRSLPEVTVALADKREVRGTIIGLDPPTDIALLKIDRQRAPGDRVGRLEQAPGR